MEQSQKTPNRKKILLWGAAILSSITIGKFIAGSKKEKKETVKLLTQDGKLVEVDIEKLSCGNRKKISDEQLKSWVKR